MRVEWEKAEKELRKVKVSSTGENELVTIKGSSDAFECIGVGTDAAVFRFFQMPHLAFKVYSDDKLDKKALETEVYLKLGRSEYYPEYYGSGSNFLVISYEEGITLHDCLLKGIRIYQSDQTSPQDPVFVFDPRYKHNNKTLKQGKGFFLHIDIDRHISSLASLSDFKRFSDNCSDRMI
jgi:hypothetical protein